ncbi:MAG: galactokinase family protein [Sulfolobales archaeon]
MSERSGDKEIQFIRRVFRGYREFYTSDPEIIVSAPGRIDFLNTHQDYKGLPVIAVGINLRTYVAAGRNLYSNHVTAVSENLRDSGERYVDSFDLDGMSIDKSRWFGSYVRAAVKTLIIEGYDLKPFNIWIYSEIPMGAGLGSSGTLLVSIIYSISELHRFNLDPGRIAELAYVAEHDVLGIPCGRLDQYAAAFGGVSIIDTRPPYKVSKIDLGKGFFVVFDSGIRHSTSDIHPRRQAEIDKGLEMLRSIIPQDLRSMIQGGYNSVYWEGLREEVLEPYLQSLPHPYSSRILYTLKAHRSTLDAVRILRGEKISSRDLDYIIRDLEIFLGEKPRIENDDLSMIGAIMTYQHSLLSRLYEVSLPALDEIVFRAISYGALGAKLSGAGLGGVVIALARDRRTSEKILRGVLEDRLAVRGWIVEIDRGVSRHEISRE